MGEETQRTRKDTEMESYQDELNKFISSVFDCETLKHYFQGK